MTSCIIHRVTRRILIAEDDADIRGLFRHALVLAGFDVQEAGDGLAAVQLIDDSPPDLVVLDLGLPYLSGHAVRLKITSQPHTRNIPIIVVTGRAEHRDVSVSSVLQKPVTPDRLVEEVRKCFAAAETSKAS